MVDSFEINYKEDGDVYFGSDERENNTFSYVGLINFALDGATTTNQDNLKVDLFGSDTADFALFMAYNSGTDLYECIDTSQAGNAAYYVIIEATALTIASFEINGCQVFQVATGKWIVLNNTGTYEVNRGLVMETLFESGTDGDGGQAPIVADTTSVTAIKTPDTRDQSKRATWSFLNVANPNSGTFTGTFSETSTNTNCSSWSQAEGSGTTGRWELPSGTILNTNTDEFGTDTSGDITDNPADCQSEVSNGAKNVRVIILHVGSVGWAEGGTVANSHDYDFFDDGSIPVMTAVSESELTCILITDSTTITTSETVAVVKSIHTLTGANTIATEISFDDGSNWLGVTQKILEEVTNTGTDFRVRFTITRANNDEEDSITSYAAYYG